MPAPFPDQVGAARVGSEKKSSPLPAGAAIPYVAPFALFGLLSYLGPLLDITEAAVYPAKTALAALCLFLFRDAWRREIRPTPDGVALAAGVAVFFIWVLPEHFLPQIPATRFNPYEYAEGPKAALLIAVRLAGEVLVVPLMAELFWRSFALRYLIRDDFREVPPGTFSWFSFIAVSIACGLWHHRWLAGILAGVIYALVLYRRRNLFAPVLAHAVANFFLGIYVLLTHQWSLW